MSLPKISSDQQRHTHMFSFKDKVKLVSQTLGQVFVYFIPVLHDNHKKDKMPHTHTHINNDEMSEKLKFNISLICLLITVAVPFPRSSRQNTIASY